MEDLKKIVSYIKERIDKVPELALILGSGLGVIADEVENSVEINYSEIPNFPVSTVKGHDGKMVFGDLNGVSVMVFKGRFHYYEGYSMDKVVLPIRVIALLGIKKLILTNAAGGVNKSFVPGDLMLITDHLGIFCPNPLIGPNYSEFGPRFNDLSYTYSKEMQDVAKEAALKHNIELKTGVYSYGTGPSYETPADIRALATLGADAVGMSTVPEVIVASHAGINLAAISCITNMAAGILPQPLDHSEVIETADRIKEDFVKFIKQFVEDLKGL